MKRRAALFGWVLSVAFLALAAGSTWKTVQLSPEVGGAIVNVSGFDVYPIAGALALLQLAALAVVLLVTQTLGKLVQGITAISSLVMFLFAVSDWSSQTLRTSILAISETIGISGETGQEQFLVSAEVSAWPILFLVALFVNASILLLAVTLPSKAATNVTERDKDEDTDDLWESQKA